MRELTPRRIVEALDEYIIGQDEAKRCVAIAIRNRWRRQQLAEEMREEVAPKNIIMIGPTGVGKTEIARRLAHLVEAPFLKVEASKYTEVGYHGRDVESMVRDLAEIGVNMVRAEHMETAKELAEAAAEERVLDALLPIGDAEAEADLVESHRQAREKLRERLRAGEFDDELIEVIVEERPVAMVEMISSAGVEQMGVDFQNMFEKMLPTRSQGKIMPVKEAANVFYQQESEKLIDRDKVVKEALGRVEDMGIIFLDEIDKIVGPDLKGSGPDVSREGVQRDLLPIVEGSTVVTRYGMVRTDHVLFVAAGAFSGAKPSDLIPELQGRFPIRVSLDTLSKEDFIRILREPKNALTKQYQALLETEGVELVLTDDAVEKLAEIAASVNSRTQNIGARRLHTVMEKVLEEISFDAPDLEEKKTEVTADYVERRVRDIVEDEDLTRYVL